MRKSCFCKKIAKTWPILSKFLKFLHSHQYNHLISLKLRGGYKVWNYALLILFQTTVVPAKFFVILRLFVSNTVQNSLKSLYHRPKGYTKYRNIVHLANIFSYSRSKSWNLKYSYTIFSLKWLILSGKILFLYTQRNFLNSLPPCIPGTSFQNRARIWIWTQEICKHDTSLCNTQWHI